jgi:hypothetical protein
MSRSAEAARAAVPEADLALLEQILRSQLDGHKQLLACIERGREAVREADMEAIKRICTEENAIAQQLAELEKGRLVVVGRMTEAIHPQAAAPLSVSQITEVIDEPAGRRLSAVAGQLRATVEDVRKASAVVRGAAEALGRHMAGLMQTVHSALTRAQVYSHRGRLATGAQSQFCIDVTT